MRDTITTDNKAHSQRGELAHLDGKFHRLRRELTGGGDDHTADPILGGKVPTFVCILMEYLYGRVSD